MSQQNWNVLNMDAQDESHSSSFGVPYARVIQNDAVLACAQNYLQLCENLPETADSHLIKIANVGNLPDELLKVERGIEILCAAYTTALRNRNTEVCNDVEQELRSLSGFYQKQVAQAYFSASNILLDADEVANKPDILKQLKHSRNALQEVHYAWPENAQDKELTSFFEKVEAYGCQLGIDGRVYPEKKAEKLHILSHFSPKMTINERCA